MVDEYINILEEEDDLIQTIPVPGVQPTASGGALDIVLPPTAEGLPDQESSLEWFLRQGGEKDFTAYPKTYFGFGDTSPMYRVASEITDFIGFDVPEFLNKPVVPLGDGKKTSITQFSPTAALGALGLEFLVGENLGRTLRTMEMKEPISPFQLGELALLGFDAATLGVGGTAGAKALYKWLTQTVKKTPEDAFTLMTKNPELADDAMVGKNIDELTDEEYEKLGIGAAEAPRTSKKKKVKIELNDRVKKKLGLMTADEIPSSTVDDQLQLISKKQDKSQQIRNVKEKRFQDAMEAVENFKGPSGRIENLVPDKIVDSSFIDVKGKYTKREGDNLVSKKDMGLLQYPENKIKGKAQKAILSHTLRGLAIEDPSILAKVRQKDPQVLNQLEEARDNYTGGMVELLEEKEELLSNPNLREELFKVVEKFSPGTTKPTSALLDLSHIFPFTKTSELNPNSIFLKEGGNPKYMYLSPSYVNRTIQRRLEEQISKALVGRQQFPQDPNFAYQLDRADQLLKKVKALSIIPVDKKTSIKAGMSDRYSPTERPKFSVDDYKELLYYLLEAQSSGIKRGKPYYGGVLYNSGGFVEGDKMPEKFSVGGITNEPGQFTDSIFTGEEEDIDIKDIQMQPGFESIEDLDIFEEAKKQGYEEVQTANLMLPFLKLFGKAPDNLVSPIPTPKSELKNPTRKQKESLELQKKKSLEEDIFDPTPEDQVMDLGQGVSTTPITKTPMTSVFYSDLERVLGRPDSPRQFSSQEELFDFLNKNSIRKAEATDYRIPQILKLFPEGEPIDTATLLTQVRQAPIRGIKVHGTGFGSELINPGGNPSNLRYEGYKEPGHITGSARERVLVIPKKMLGKDAGGYPSSIRGEGTDIQFHDFGQGDENFVIGWSRLTDRYGKLPQKVEGPQTKVNVSKLKKERTKNNATVRGLMAEAETKLQRLAHRRGMNQADIEEITINTPEDIVKYKDQLDEISPGLIDQMDEITVRNRDITGEISKAETPSAEGVVRVTFADEIQSDLMQAAATRKKFLASTLKRMQDQGADLNNFSDYNDLSRKLLQFYKDNETVFRPVTKTGAELDVLRNQLSKMDEEVDNIVNKYVTTREISNADLKRLGVLLEDNVNKMLDQVLTLDSTTMEKLFPDIPFKNRSEWGDAVIKKDLYEAAYRKFILKDPNAADYYAVSPGDLVSKRYNFTGDTSTPTAKRLEDKERMLRAFKETGELSTSELRGVGMNEFYGGPMAKAPAKYVVVDKNQPIKGPAGETIGYKKVKDYVPTESKDDALNYMEANSLPDNYDVIKEQKHYTSDLEKILKKQAADNNSEIVTMPVQLKQGSMSVYRITDQNGNMVATLSDERQALDLVERNPNYKIEPLQVPDEGAMRPVFAIKITEEMLEPFVTHKAQGGLVEDIDIFEVA